MSHTDENVLASLGYKQEFKRNFSKVELFGLSFSIISIVPSIASVLFYSIPYGGPVAMVWGWLVGSFFIICIAMTVAELGSSAPTSGGLYYWTFSLSPLRYRKYFSWLVGYLNTVGYISGVAGVDYSCALAIYTAASFGSNGEFIPTNGQIYGLTVAILLSHAVTASLATKIIARLQFFFSLMNVSVLMGLIIALPVATPPELKNTAKYVFTSFENISGWNNGFSFFLSFLAPLWTVGGFDAPAHLSEEAKNAQYAVPFATVTAPVLACVLGFAFNLALAFNMGSDLVGIISNPVGQPMAVIILNSFGTTGTLAVWSLISILLYMAGMDLLIASSRQTFAFSRDGALPYSRLIYKINSKTGTPVNAVFISAFGAALLNLLSFAGPTAIGAIFTTGVMCQYICYSTPVIARFFGGQKFVPGPFSLGKMSPIVAIIASAFMIFMNVVLLFPASPAPDAQHMNYTVVVVGGTAFLCTLYYLISGRHWFVGPVSTVVSLSDGKGSSIGDEKTDEKDENEVSVNEAVARQA